MSNYDSRGVHVDDQTPVVTRRHLEEENVRLREALDRIDSIAERMSRQHTDAPEVIQGIVRAAQKRR